MTTDSPDVRVAAGQFAPGADVATNVAAIAVLAAEANAAGADLLVLPEYALYYAAPFGPETAAHALNEDGPEIAQIAALARAHGLWIVFGALEAAGERSLNTLFALDPTGTVRARYRKLHLYDAFGITESTWIAPGEIAAPQTFRIGELCFGLQTCYDIRFPEVSRTLVDAGADVLLVPAQWVPGPLKETHWSTLLAARAIENTAFVVAADHAGPSGIGLSRVLDPAGEPLAAVATGPGTATVTLRASELRRVRRVNPALNLRRFRVVPGSPQL